MTAKATKEEMNLVKHRMIDILDLFDTNYNQKSFKKEALYEINSIFQNNQIPLIVGGTNYFVESLLFNSEDKQNLEKNNINYINNNIELLDKYEFIKNLKIEDKYFLDDIKLIKNNNSDEDICYTKINEYLNKNFNDKYNNKKELNKILSILDYKSSVFYNDNDTRRIINSISYFIAYNKKKS